MTFKIIDTNLFNSVANLLAWRHKASYLKHDVYKIVSATSFSIYFTTECFFEVKIIEFVNDVFCHVVDNQNSPFDAKLRICRYYIFYPPLDNCRNKRVKSKKKYSLESNLVWIYSTTKVWETSRKINTSGINSRATC